VAIDGVGMIRLAFAPPKKLNPGVAICRYAELPEEPFTKAIGAVRFATPEPIPNASIVALAFG
jgi:hypothetical protein